MFILSSIGKAFKWLFRQLTSDRAKRAIESAANLVPEVMPIVQDLRVLDPKTATVSEIMALYEKYRVSPLTAIAPNSTSIGNALLNLATAVVKKEKPGLATSIIQAAIQIALISLKA